MTGRLAARELSTPWFVSSFAEGFRASPATDFESALSGGLQGGFSMEWQPAHERSALEKQGVLRFGRRRGMT